MKRWVMASTMLLACNGGSSDQAGATSDDSGTQSPTTAGDSADGGDTVADSTGARTTGTSSGGGGTTGSGTGGSSSESDGSSDSGTDTQGVDPTPILEREPVISHACTETRALTELAFNGGQSRAQGLVSSNGEFSLMIEDGPLELRQIDLDGTIGDTFTVATQPSYRRPIAVTTEAGIAAVWAVPGMTENLRFALISDDQQFIVEPIDVAGTSSASAIPSALVPTGDGGFAVFYGVSDNSGDTQLMRIMLDASGGADGGAVEVAEIGTSWATAPASAVPTADGGQALAYSAGGFEGSEVFFVVLDGAGTPQFQPTKISRDGGEGWHSDFGAASRRNLMAVGGEYWVTFSESYVDYEQMEGQATVSLAVVGADGDAQVHTLQAPTEGIEHRWPSFTEIDGRPALSWTTGTIIFVCAGCIGDQDLNLVILDPDSIVPASDVVTQLTTNNGIIAPLVAVDGADILTAGSLDYHAGTLAATGALECTPTSK